MSKHIQNSQWTASVHYIEHWTKKRIELNANLDKPRIERLYVLSKNVAQKASDSRKDL